MPLRVGAQELSGKAPKCHALTIIESSYIRFLYHKTDNCSNKSKSAFFISFHYFNLFIL